LQPAAPTLTSEERIQRINALLAYRGDDPQVLARRERLIQLFDQCRARRAKAEERRASKQQ